MSFRVNQKVELLNKNCQGVVKFVGSTSFGAGQWIGIVLSEPIGKNNGTVQGRTYFKCSENYGIFVRPNQVAPLSGGGTGSKTSSRRSSVSIDDDSERSLLEKRKSNLIARSRQSLNSSKLSLNASRQSLNDLQLPAMSPVNCNSNTDPDSPNPQSLSKCESFIETEFVENLMPEFKQPLTRSYLQQAVDEKYYIELQESNAKLLTDTEELRKQIRELQEKHEKLQKSRSHDKERTKDFEVLKLQNDQLTEFKSKIMETHQHLQREFQKMKNEYQEMQVLRDGHTKEMTELMNLLEMATLDKEMAEERVEMVQADLDACREKLDELQCDMNILKEEIDNNHSLVIADDDDHNKDKIKYSYQMKQIEQQNIRLRDVLIKMRDVAADDKSNYQKLVKELETKKSEIAELSKNKEKLSARVEEQENQILELQAQIDATLGSEEMIVVLTDQKLNLEDRVEQLENNLNDLQTLKDVLEQINEANHEVNVDLREEIEMQQVTITKLRAKNESLIEVISDREVTIGKFRELVQQLHEQLHNMKEVLSQQQQSSFNSMANASFSENIEFQKIFQETKAYLQNVDFELRKIEVQELLQYINYLMSFMPDSFKIQGGDHDSVLTLLLISRLNLKTDVLLNQIRDKFSHVQEFDKNLAFRDHYLQQFTFRTRFCTHIGVVQCLLHQYSYTLNTCSMNILENTTGVYNEMMSQEKVVNNFLDLLKKNELDENQNLEPIERSIIYFYTMLPLLMDSEITWNQLDLLNDFVNFLSSSLDEFQTYIEILNGFALSNAQGGHEIEQLIDYCSNCLKKWQVNKKVLRRKLTSNSFQGPSLGLEHDFYENVFNCYFHSLKLSKTLLKVVEGAIKLIQQQQQQQSNIENEMINSETIIDCDQLMDLATSSSASVYEQDDLGPLNSIKRSLEFIMKHVEFLLHYFEENETSLVNSTKNLHVKRKPPITIKAELFKDELDEVKGLRREIERKDSDLQTLKSKLKTMQENVSEMKLRKEIAEKKLDNVQNYKCKIDELVQEKDQLKSQFDTKCKDYETMCNNLKHEIASLDKDRNELNEKLQYCTTTGNIGSGSGGDMVSGINEVLLDEIRRLKNSLRVVHSEKVELIVHNLIEKAEKLKPIKFYTVNDIREDRLMILNRELNDIYDDIMSVYLQYKIIDWNNREEALKRLKERLNQKRQLQMFNDRYQRIQIEIRDELLERRIGGKVFGDFKDFPTIDLIESLKENEPLIFGEIKIPNLMKKVHKPATLSIRNNSELRNIVNCLKI